MVTKKTHSQSSHRLLDRLAELFGVQTRYRDALGRQRHTSDASLTQTLHALGADVNGESDIPSPARLEAAVRGREAELWQRMIEPVCVAWDGRLPDLVVRLPVSVAGSDATILLSLTHEDGSQVHGEVPVDRLREIAGVRVEGGDLVAVRVPAGVLSRALGAGPVVPAGYHRLRIETGQASGETLLVSAPRRCWESEGPANRLDGQKVSASGAERTPQGRGREVSAGHEVIEEALRGLASKEWALFAPVYALRSGRDWGAGDLSDLGALLHWAGDRGASLVATLPLLAASFGEGADPSPYRPLTRLFWNEFFLDPESVDEWPRCDAARRRADRVEVRRQREALRATELVDYRAVMGLKRPVLEELARCFLTQPHDATRQGYQAYLQDHPSAHDYAAFRAAEEGPGGGTAAVRAGTGSGETGLSPEQYHLYCQWQMDRQLAGLSAEGRPGLLFDLPLGVHPEGFDVARWPELFATGVSTGAPPDMFFANGQDWTTPPPHPEADRLGGYAYFAACLRNLMRHAAALRIDHMMSFHRLFWIPAGAEPRDGAYVTYRAEELYAVLSRESHRHQTIVVGEDLGTVPNGVRASMSRHGVHRTWIFLGSLKPRAKDLVAEIPSGSLVTLETHDMVPLAGFLCGDDIQTRQETGQLDLKGARRESAVRRRLVARLARRFEAPDDPGRAAPAILAGCLAFLGRSAAKIVLVSLEDLLLERRPQNVPGTRSEWPNWRRKIAVALEKLPRSRR